MRNLPEIINPKSLTISALFSALSPLLLKNINSLSYSDWITMLSLSAGSIISLIAQLKESRIVSANDLKRFIHLNSHHYNDNYLISKTVIDSDIFVYLNELYLCQDAMFIVDANTHELEWTNSAGARQLKLEIGKPLPKRDLRQYWRPSDYEQLQDILCNLQYGKAVIHDYEAAFSTPLDWRSNTAQFRLIELNNGQIKRISRTVGMPIKKEIPIDMRIRQSKL